MTFSIITITFQAEAVLQRTLDSVLTQTYPHIEHLIVDGASKDGTLAIAKNYQQQSDAQHNGHTVIVQSEPIGCLRQIPSSKWQRRLLTDLL